MANTRQIKRRISATKNISKITKAMEMVAASKMKRAQDQATASRPYARALESSLKKLSKDVNPELHPLLSDHGVGLETLLVISTDKGLCGGLNAQLFKEVTQWLKQHPQGQIIAVGRKAVHFARLTGIKLHSQFTDLPEHISINDIVGITEMVIGNFLDQTFQHVSVVYMDFINTLSQKVRLSQLLPLAPSDNYQDYSMTTPELRLEYSFEPDASTLLDQLLPYYIENTVYQAFLESRASEHSARMVTMKNASENATELMGELQLEFNKSRQASITNELLDITTASLTIS